MTMRTGTPPRGRGPREDIRVGPVDGNTPARAGTTVASVLVNGRSGEHPRAGGDDGPLVLLPLPH